MRLGFRVSLWTGGRPTCTESLTLGFSDATTSRMTAQGQCSPLRFAAVGSFLLAMSARWIDQ